VTYLKVTKALKPATRHSKLPVRNTRVRDARPAGPRRCACLVLCGWTPTHTVT